MKSKVKVEVNEKLKERKRCGNMGKKVVTKKHIESMDEIFDKEM